MRKSNEAQKIRIHKRFGRYSTNVQKTKWKEERTKEKDGGKTIGEYALREGIDRKDQYPLLFVIAESPQSALSIFLVEIRRKIGYDSYK